MGESKTIIGRLSKSPPLRTSEACEMSTSISSGIRGVLSETLCIRFSFTFERFRLGSKASHWLESE